MDENGLKSADRGESVENKVAHFTASEPPSEGQASDSKLQVVWCDSKLRELWSPKLDPSEEVAHDWARTGPEGITASPDSAQNDGRSCRAPGERPNALALASAGCSSRNRGHTRGIRRISLHCWRCSLLARHRSKLPECRGVGWYAINEGRTRRIVGAQDRPRNCDS
jgi:hypothetical protein